MIWKDEKVAKEHLDDLKQVKEHVEKEFDNQKNTGALVDKGANEYRMKVIDKLIEEAERESQDKKEEDKNPGIK